jgi:hypothetical protein
LTERGWWSSARLGAVRSGLVLGVDLQWLGVVEDRRLRVSDQRKLTAVRGR